MEVGDIYKNTINNSTGRIVEIKDGIVTYYCEEKTSGFLHVVTEPVVEGTFRSHDIDYLIKRYIKTGIFKKLKKT